MTVPAPSVAAVATLPKRLNAIRHVPLKEYRKKHRYPWIVAYSGGKDSTLLLQLVWEVVAGLPAEAQRRRVLVVGNDTLVESPLIIQHLRESLKAIGLAAEREALPIDTEITEPRIDQTFWVNVIGRGYISPTRNFRWCTDRMKILPTNRLLERITRDSKGTILLIGSRRAESQNRRRPMDQRKSNIQSDEPSRASGPLPDVRPACRPGRRRRVDDARKRRAPRRKTSVSESSSNDHGWRSWTTVSSLMAYPSFVEKGDLNIARIRRPHLIPSPTVGYSSSAATMCQYDRTLLALLPAEGRERSVPILQALILPGMCL